MCPSTWISGGHLQILGDTPNLSHFYLLPKLHSYPEISVHFLFKFELHVDSLGSRRSVDDSEVLPLL